MNGTALCGEMIKQIRLRSFGQARPPLAGRFDVWPAAGEGASCAHGADRRAAQGIDCFDVEFEPRDGAGTPGNGQ